jgi:hypothetical protein
MLPAVAREHLRWTENSSALLPAEELGNLLVVRGGEHNLVGETTLTLGGLVLEDVVLVGTAAHDLAGTGDPETALGSTVGLVLRHVAVVSYSVDASST